jgi:hypothetical protein
MKLSFLCSISACIFLVVSGLSAQTPDISTQSDLTIDAVAPGNNLVDSSATEPTLPTQYRQFRLGMSLDELKTALAEDEGFVFRGDRDVSLLPNSDQQLLESAGTGIIQRAFFQLRGSSVFIMSFNLNERKMDHFSVFQSLVSKYGQPNLLDPARAVWQSETVRVSLERPLTIKYIDMLVFSELQEQSLVRQSRDVQERQEFLDDL